ncbi:hypothetical protein QFC21_000513 [Naganishia friedmannii]|uniref:Uncharacterized protein n=1 Tax=Naganishia friedmannii TaxID=89922 RepID=A0ACC2WDB6_9TREE|nr:hypothetical protein QFC21_000513 [Naganishia friedmannii]
MQQPPNLMHHQAALLAQQQQQQQHQQQQPLPKKRKQTGGSAAPGGGVQQHMMPGMPGVNPVAMQGMHPAIAQQMVLKRMPEPEDPAVAEMEELTATDMAIARYRTRHEWMNEVFSPISLAGMPPPPNPYEYLHAKALEDQIVQLERQALDIEKHGLARLEETKASFAAVEREVHEQQASIPLNSGRRTQE